MPSPEPVFRVIKTAEINENEIKYHFLPFLVSQHQEAGGCCNNPCQATSVDPADMCVEIR